MAMVIPFYIGAYFSIGIFMGFVILFVWERLERKDGQQYLGAMALGLICGDGIWIVPSAIISFYKVNPPACMLFSST